MRVLGPALALAGAAALPDFPNIHRLGYGIDLLKSNPEEQASDPGVRGLVLDVQQSYSQGRTWEGKYRLPDGVAARPDPRCAYDALTVTVHDTSSFQATLADIVKTRVHGIFWAHTWTDEYDYVKSATESSASVFTRAKATCVAYEAALEKFELSGDQLAPDFLKGVASIDPSDSDSLAQFVGVYGTHYLAEAVMGGSVTKTTQFSSANFTALQQAGVDLDAAGKLDVYQTFGGDVSGFDGSDDLSAFRAHASSELADPVKATPFMPPTGPDVVYSADGWASKVQLPDGQPDLIAYELADLSELLNAQFFPNDTDIAAKASALQSYIDTQYCSDMGCPLPSHQVAWTAETTGSSPAALAVAASATLGNQTFFFGGWDNGYVDENVAMGFDAGSAKWSFVQPLPWAGGGAAAAVVQDVALVCGGIPVAQGVEADATSQCAVFDPSAPEAPWSAAAPMNQSTRFNFALQELDGAVYAIGGYPGSHGYQPLADVERYDPAADAWTPVAPLPLAGLMEHAAEAYAGRLYVFGGRLLAANGDGYLVNEAVFVYDPDADAWTALGNSMPTPRWGLSTAFVPPSFVFALGGAVDELGDATDTVDVLDLESQQWWASPPALPGTMAFGSAAAVAGADNATELHAFGGFTGEWSGQTASAQHFQATIYADFAPFVLGRPLGAGGRPMRDFSAAHEAAPDNTFPSVDYMGFGYNVVKGNPAADLYDQGWSATPAFDVACGECFSENRTFDAWAVPDGVDVNVLESCSYDATAFTIRDRTELTNFLEASVGIDLRLGTPLLTSVKWSAGGALQASLSAALDAGAAIVVAKADCEAYSMALSQYAYPYAWTDNFLQALEALPESVEADPEAFYSFVETFGTHLPTAMTLGGTAQQKTFLAQLSLSELLTGELDVQFAAQASFLLFWGSSHTEIGDLAFQQYLDLQASAQYNTTSCSPACPPHQEDVMTNSTAWQDSVMLPDGLPVPVKTTLVDLPSLLVADHFPSAMADVVAGAQATLTEFLNSTYCGMVEGCSDQQQQQQQQYWAPSNSPLPEGASAAAAAQVGDLWVVASSDQTLVLNGSDPSARWSYLTPLPSSRTRASAAVSPAGEVVVMGGLDAATGVASADVAALAVPATGDGWAALEPMPEARYGQAAAQIADTVYLVGGVLADGSFSGCVQSLNLTSGAWALDNATLSAVEPRAFASAVALGDGRVYVFGGQRADGSLLADVQVYDPASRTWAQSQVELPVPVARAQALVVDGKALLMGGMQFSAGAQASAPSASAFSFSPASSRWTTLPSLPQPLMDAAAFASPSSSQVSVVGGVTADETDALVSVSSIGQ